MAFTRVNVCEHKFVYRVFVSLCIYVCVCALQSVVVLLRVRAYVSGIDGTTSDIVLSSSSLGLASVGLRWLFVGR